MERHLSARELRTAARQASAVARSSANEEVSAYLLLVAQRLIAEAEMLENSPDEESDHTPS